MTDPEHPPLRTIAVEEHWWTEGIARALDAVEGEHRDDAHHFFNVGDRAARLHDVTEMRLADMDDEGIDVQVLSIVTPATQTLSAADAVPLAREANDRARAVVDAHPDRFAALATLPTPDPEAAAAELERALDDLGLCGVMLCGRTRDRRLDHPAFAPVFEVAARHGVPVLLHPQIPSRAVRESYYSGFGDPLDLILATGGLGWHAESGIDALRLILAGTFDRHPDLQIILGHWGEVVLFYLQRIDIMSGATSLQRRVSDYFRDNVHVLPSGIFDHRMLARAVEEVGTGRIMLAGDYPFQRAQAGGARRFLETAQLAPEARQAIAHGNAERLFGLAPM